MSNDTTMRPSDRQGDNHASEIAADERLNATEAAVECLRAYAKERPEVVALWAFGVGFVLGWKLKFW